MKKCKSQEYAYSGMEYGKQCFCSNTPPPQEAVIKTSSCSTACPGDSASKCGGSWKLSVYETGDKTLALLETRRGSPVGSRPSPIKLKGA